VSRWAPPRCQGERRRRPRPKSLPGTPSRGEDVDRGAHGRNDFDPHLWAERGSDPRFPVPVVGADYSEPLYGSRRDEGRPAVSEQGLDRRWIQVGGAAGVVAAALEVAAGVVAGGAPSGSATTAEVTTYLSAHRSGILAQTVLAVAGLAFGAWFLGTLARLIQTRDSRSPLGLIALVGGTAALAVAAFDGLTLTTLEFVSEQGGPADPALTRAFFDLQNGIVMPGAFGLIITVFLVAVGVAILRRTFAARWLGWLSIVFSALSVLSGLLGLTLKNGGTTPFSYFPAIGFGVIAIASGIYMLRDRVDVAAATVASR
jgi:hypothetical protein